jgi:hypothetical protein
MTTTQASRPRIHSAWQGLFDPRSPRIRQLAHTTLAEIPPELRARFCAKMLYWRSHTSVNPITITVSDTELWPIHRGCSRLIAGVVYDRPMLMRVWCTGSNPQQLLDEILTARTRLRKIYDPHTAQTPVPNFERDLIELTAAAPPFSYFEQATRP